MVYNLILIIYFIGDTMKDYTKNKELHKKNGFSHDFNGYCGMVTYSLRRGFTRINAVFTLQELTHPVLRKMVANRLMIMRQSIKNNG